VKIIKINVLIVLKIFQVIIAKNLLNESKNRSVVQKIVLQMNCKIGGSLWTVKIPFKNVMVCGIDSYHDPYNQGSSVAGKINKSLTKEEINNKNRRRC